MNSPFWALVGIGTILVLLGIFRIEKKLSYADMTELLRGRQEYLPQLRDITEKMLTRMEELAIEAGKTPLEDYYQRYLTHNNDFKKTYNALASKQMDESTKRQMAIINTLHKFRFHKNNLYLAELEDKDTDGLITLKKEYGIYYSRNRDPKLARELNKLFRRAKLAFSIRAMAEIGKCNKLPYKSPRTIAMLYERPELSDSLLKDKRDATNKRFDELLRGEDL